MHFKLCVALARAPVPSCSNSTILIAPSLPLAWLIIARQHQVNDFFNNSNRKGSAIGSGAGTARGSLRDSLKLSGPLGNDAHASEADEVVIVGSDHSDLAHPPSAFLTPTRPPKGREVSAGPGRTKLCLRHGASCLLGTSLICAYLLLRGLGWGSRSASSPKAQCVATVAPVPTGGPCQWPRRKWIEVVWPPVVFPGWQDAGS